MELRSRYIDLTDEGGLFLDLEVGNFDWVFWGIGNGLFTCWKESFLGYGKSWIGSWFWCA